MLSPADLIDAIRKYIKKSLDGVENCDPWDEGLGGAGWLENELGLFEEMRWYNTTQNKEDHKKVVCTIFEKLSAFRSPLEFQDYVANKDHAYIEELYAFIKEGGSNAPSSCAFITNRTFPICC